jgi:uncharacterized membrane protein
LNREMSAMDNIALILIEVVSTLLCFILLRFMIKPYRTTGEGRYLGLPLGFVFLGTSYILMGASLYFGGTVLFASDIKWLQLFTQSYAFAFLAATYYFSKKPSKNTRLWWDFTYAALMLIAAISYLIVVEHPQFGLPSHKVSDQYFMLFNIVCLAYISFHTIRSHVSNPDPKKIWIPFAYLLLGVSQYSSLIWSIDTSYSAFIGAHFLRLASLIIFLFVSYRTFYLSLENPPKEGAQDEKTPTKR